MLHELNIEDYAVVDKLRVGFERGLNLLTGETGSGKSIVVDALSLLLGARASADVIRGDARQARICGVFEPSPTAQLISLLDEAGFELEDGELIVERQISAAGKTRCWINARPATVSFLRDLAPFLGDIHGQHDQQKLFSSSEQLEMLDAFAGTAEQAARLGDVHRRLRELRAKLAELRGDEQERLRLLDLYRFQQQEIAAATLVAGEEERLRSERAKLLNLGGLRDNASSAYDALYEAGESAAARLKAARTAVETLAGFDPAFAPMLETLASAQAGVEDAAFELGKYLEQLEADPSRQEAVEERLVVVENLKRKYGSTLDAVIAYGVEAAQRVAELESSEQTAEGVEKELEQVGEKYRTAARKLSDKRRKAAGKLASQVEAELHELALEKARFSVACEREDDPEQWRADGIDRVRFEFSANPGQPLKPLTQVASGGELSRVTLAIKTCLTADPGDELAVPRTLVFDEIDTGVGGSVAESIGRRLARLSIAGQVLCVTHLPQIAGFADAHYFVAKSERKGLTYATVSALDQPERIAELARMLSGSEVTKAALDNAKQLLKSGAGRRGPRTRKGA